MCLKKIIIYRINDLNGVDLPPEVRTQLKSLAFEIAGSCVFDLNIDPRNSIFSLGKTSSLLGHNVMVILNISLIFITM